MSLAEKIAYLRKRNSLSQEELSERLDVSRQAVSKWEAAESVPDIANLADVCSVPVTEKFRPTERQLRLNRMERAFQKVA